LANSTLKLLERVERGPSGFVERNPTKERDHPGRLHECGNGDSRPFRLITLAAGYSFAPANPQRRRLDRTFRYCALNREGKIVDEGERRLNPDSLRKFLAAQPAARVALETGAHSAWVEALAQQLGHETIVANARELRAVTGRNHRSDAHDAPQLARLARVDGELLNPVRLRGAEQQADLFVIRARAMLVEAQTRLINFARGITKTTGRRLPSADAERFSERARQTMPEALRPALMPLLNVLDQIAQELAG
jgi:transposase